MKVVIVAAFLICGGSEFQTEGPKMAEGTIIILQKRGIKRTSVFRLPECLTAGPDRLTFHAAFVHVGLADGKGQDERMSQQDPTRSKHIHGSKECCLLGQNIRISAVIPFSKLQNDT